MIGLTGPLRVMVATKPVDFRKGAEGPLLNFLDSNLSKAGNGAHEVRNWLVAHGAAQAQGFELIDYFPVPEVYVGCGFAAWNIAHS